jgi:hypothetical protein
MPLLLEVVPPRFHRADDHVRGTDPRAKAAGRMYRYFLTIDVLAAKRATRSKYRGYQSFLDVQFVRKVLQAHFAQIARK